MKTVNVKIEKITGATTEVIKSSEEVTLEQLNKLVRVPFYRITFVDDGTVAGPSNIMDKFYGSSTADAVAYDNSESGLTSENVQEAIDEVSQGGGGGGGSDTEWFMNVDKSKIDWSTYVYSGDHPTYEEFVEGIKNGKSRLVVNCVYHEASGAVAAICNSSVNTILTSLESHGSDDIRWYYDINGSERPSDKIMAEISSDNVMKLYHLGFE